MKIRFVPLGEKRTKDTYEAAFYMLWGASFVNVSSHVLESKRAKKKGFARVWSIYLSNVPQWAVETWSTGEAYGNITKFVDVRTKLKKRIKRELGVSKS